jgi:hypothetical protein
MLLGIGVTLWLEMLASMSAALGRGQGVDLVTASKWSRGARA